MTESGDSSKETSSGKTAAKLQVIGSADRKSSVSSANLSARDYSPNFQERVCARFVAIQNIRQTARDFAIPARVVSEILHLASFKRAMSVARSSMQRYVGVERRRA